MYIAYILFSYIVIACMILTGVPFHPQVAHADPFIKFSLHFVVAFTLTCFTTFYQADLSESRRKLLTYAGTPVYCFISLFLFALINNLLVIYPVTPDTVSGLLILLIHFLMVLVVIITPAIYITNKIPQKNSSDKDIPPIINNNALWRIIEFIIDAISLLFLLYNIVFQARYLIGLLCSVIIARVAYSMLTAGHTKAVTRSLSICIRVISFLILLTCLVAMFSMATGFW